MALRRVMNVAVERVAADAESTLGVLFVDGQFGCFTLEDQHQTEKVFGETRIPPGRYLLGLRKFGGFHHRYGNKFGDRHRGMIQILDVTDFEDVLIHIGNDDDDTAGCILVGNGVMPRGPGGWRVSNSTDAYWRIYPIIADELIAGREVGLQIVDRAK